MKRIAITLLFLALFDNISAQTQPADIIRTFFQKYKDKNSDEAIDYFFTHTGYAEDMAEGIDDLKRKLRKQMESFGLYYGYDSLTVRSAGPNLKMFTFLIRHARQPLLFFLTFYKSENRWQAYSFRYTSEVTTELEEASKIYRLKENY